MRAVRRPRPQTTALTVIDPDHERTIFVVGRTRTRPRRPAGLGRPRGVDAVYFTGDDPRTLVAARAAPVVVATARRLPAVVASGVEVDAIAGSAQRPGRADRSASALPVRPRAIVRTDGRAGGSGRPPTGARDVGAGRSRPGRSLDAYGAGDSFVAGVTYGLGPGRSSPRPSARRACGRRGRHARAGRTAARCRLSPDRRADADVDRNDAPGLGRDGARRVGGHRPLLRVAPGAGAARPAARGATGHFDTEHTFEHRRTDCKVGLVG